MTTTFTWDVAAGLPVVLDDGSQYVYGLGLVSQVSGGNTYYYLADGLGSTMKTIDSSGAVVNSYTYDVYGSVTSSSGGQANEFQFAGQQTDPTGLQYLRARYYDPTTGRFLSRDPLALLPGWNGNPTHYASGNPVGRIDPWGLREVDADGCEPANDSCHAAAASRCGAGSWCQAGNLRFQRGPDVWVWDAYSISSDGHIQFGRCTLLSEKSHDQPQCSPYESYEAPFPFDLSDIALGWAGSGLQAMHACAADSVCSAAVSVAIQVAVGAAIGSGHAELQGPLEELAAAWLAYSAVAQGIDPVEMIDPRCGATCPPQ